MGNGGDKEGEEEEEDKRKRKLTIRRGRQTLKVHIYLCFKQWHFMQILAVSQIDRRIPQED